MAEPVILGLAHRMNYVHLDRDASERGQRAADFLDGLPGSVRRIFLEASQDQIESMSKGRSPEEMLDSDEPFCRVIGVARKNKWKIIPLDWQSVSNMQERLIGNFASPVFLMSQREKKLLHFLNQNFRMNLWSKRVRNLHAGKSDVIVMHPNHVKPFLKYSGFSRKNVVWISRPQTNTAGMLGAKGLREITIERNLTRRARQRKKDPDFFKGPNIPKRAASKM